MFFICYNNKKMEKITFHITGMHCNSCKLLLENTIGKVKNIEHIDVNVKNGTAIV